MCQQNMEKHEQDISLVEEDGHAIIKGIYESLLELYMEGWGN